MLTIFSDPHLGCNRNSHTTPASRERLKQALFDQARGIAPFTLETFSNVVCLGDLYDTFWSDAKSFKQGLDIYQNLDICLVGNHDFSQRANATSALELCHNIVENKWDDPSVSSIQSHPTDGFYIQYINHKMTQDLFDESLEKVRAIGGLLFLHCNYDNGLAKDEASLNLTREQAEFLLTKVDKIFIGHEHISRTDFDGRLIITGNTHPTSFSDISDKYVWKVDNDLNVTKELIWDAKKGYLKFDYKSLFEDIYLDGYQFLEITGQAEASELPKIARAISNLWKTYPDALMIKNAVTCSKQVVEATKTTEKLDILSKVTKELQDSKLYDLWCAYKGRLDETN